MTAYHQLETRFRRLGGLEEAIALLHWDAAAMMPPGGAAARAEQLATLRLLAHDLLVAPELGDLLAEAESDAGPDTEANLAEFGPWQRANLREMRRRWLHAVSVPGELVEALSRARSECETQWRAARPAADFARVEPALERVLRLTREVADAKSEWLGISPYEALLAQYEPGGSTAAIDRLFGEIVEFLPDLLEEILARQARQSSPAAPAGPFPVQAQRQVAIALAQAVGFDFAHGRLDVSAHPFCGGTPDDVRITTRYEEADFSRALMGVLHETGHGLYKRGLPPEWRWQPVGAARGMAVHESQSLLLEMQVCRSPAFAVFAAPLLRTAFGGSGPGWEPVMLHRRQVAVSPGLIRVDADEVTYPAHVILRYRLERAMVAGQLPVSDLPGAWGEGLTKLLGIAPNNDRDGCLQDIHWFDGAWGYFPTYTLGALIAAQLFAAARAAIPDLLDSIAEGEFGSLLAWLREHVHAKGSLLSTEALVEEATGAPLGTAAFERHLRSRYLQ
ncbi:MAG: carboxypeptidase M32 [Alphaproteobacteria bacterium]|nr:carboxypeptidase M32 [Alphaproteobacteria bacterium]